MRECESPSLWLQPKRCLHVRPCRVGQTPGPPWRPAPGPATATADPAGCGRVGASCSSAPAATSSTAQPCRAGRTLVAALPRCLARPPRPKHASCQGLSPLFFYSSVSLTTRWGSVLLELATQSCTLSSLCQAAPASRLSRPRPGSSAAPRARATTRLSRHPAARSSTPAASSLPSSSPEAPLHPGASSGSAPAPPLLPRCVRVGKVGRREREREREREGGGCSLLSSRKPAASRVLSDARTHLSAVMCLSLLSPRLSQASISATTSQA